MTDQDKLHIVGRLSGFLYGVCSATNPNREYNSFAFCIDLVDREVALSEIMSAHYEGATFPNAGMLELPFGAASIEKRVQEYLIPNCSLVPEDARSELRRYLAFRLMDMIRDFLDESPRRFAAFELHGAGSRSEVILFCIKLHARLLVLHFRRPLSEP